MSSPDGKVLVIKRLCITLVAGMLGVVAAIVVGAPAQASNTDVGNPATEDRCYGLGYDVCLYWDAQSHQAYYHATADFSNASSKTFQSGTGSGAGESLYHNVASVWCSDAVTQCTSYSGTGYTGNLDHINYGGLGVSYYTFNSNGSFSFVF